MIDMDGRLISKAYDLNGNLILQSNPRKAWWVFNRQEPLDFLSRHESGKDEETARVYISHGMEIKWA